MCEYDVPDVVLLARGKSGSGTDRRMHIPDPDDPTDSVCRFNGRYRERSREGLRGHFDWCQFCAERLADGGDSDE